jgi:drug/metabolite transporter (DMT)-like permease
MSLKKGAGFLFALAGVLAIRKIEDFRFSDVTAVGDLLTVVNCLSFALFLSLSKKFAQENDRFWMTTYLFLYASIAISLMAIPDYIRFVWPPIEGELLGAMIYSVVGATLMTYFLNVWVLAFVPSSVASLFGYFQPIVAAGVSWFWLSEPPTARTVVAGGLIFFGMLLSVSWSKKPT